MESAIRALVAGLIVGLYLILIRGGAVSAAPAVGQATIIVPISASSNAGNALDSGGSSDDWQIHLPTGSACTKDTTSNAYHVYTFVAPTSIDPASFLWDSGGPHDPAASPNPNVYPLYDSGGSPFIATPTVPVSAIVPDPQPQGGTASFSWALFSADGSGGTNNTLPVGAYNVGIACVDANSAIDKLWDVVVTFAASTTDPNHETWTASNPSSTATTTTTTTTSSTTSTTTSTTSTSTTTSTTSTTGTANNTTTTSSSTVAGNTTTGSTVFGTQSGTNLATTGSKDMTVSDWGVIMISVGLMAVLATRQRRRRDGGR